MQSVAGDSVSRIPLAGNLFLYEASLSDVDASVVSTFGNVYAITASGLVMPSSERQGVLVLQPIFSGSHMILDTNPNYAAILISKGVTDFSNTKIGLLDTGFDDGTNTHPDFQAGGPQVTVLTEPNFPSGKDLYTHGTLTASVAVGYAPIGSARKDAQGFRFTLGLAESCKLVSDKIFECVAGNKALLGLALDNTMAPQNVNIISDSINDTSMCKYTSDSALFDSHTRSHNWLFTVAAGNSSGGGCPTVQSPATAKNGIAVGATNSYTPQGWLNCPPTGTCGIGRADSCSWNATQSFPDQNARNIPSFSCYRDNASVL